MLLPACAMTATLLTTRRPSVPPPRDTGRGQRDDQAPDADEETRGHVRRVMHPAVHPRQRDEERDRDRDKPDDQSERAASHPDAIRSAIPQ